LTGGENDRVFIDLNNYENSKTPAWNFSMTGVSGRRQPAVTVNVPIAIDLEENHSYHIAMRLGKVMKVMFEVTQWDNGDDAIQIDVPSFE
jgi:hypothetical protein